MQPPQDSVKSDAFAPTPWPLLFQVAQNFDPDQANKALGTLCQIYWRPVYTFLRARGYSWSEAQDLTQCFILYLIVEKRFAGADPARGNLRSYMLGALKHFLAHNERNEKAQRRGGGAVTLPLEETLMDGTGGSKARCAGPPTPHPADRGWARNIHRRITKRLIVEYAVAGKSDLYDALRPYLTAEEDRGFYEKAAGQLGRPVATLRSDVARMRARYRELLRIELCAQAPNTVFNEEVRYYFRLLAAED